MMVEIPPNLQHSFTSKLCMILFYEYLGMCWQIVVQLGDEEGEKRKQELVFEV